MNKPELSTLKIKALSLETLNLKPWTWNLKLQISFLEPWTLNIPWTHTVFCFSLYSILPHLLFFSFSFCVLTPAPKKNRISGLRCQTNCWLVSHVFAVNVHCFSCVCLHFSFSILSLTATPVWKIKPDTDLVRPMPLNESFRTWEAQAPNASSCCVLVRSVRFGQKQFRLQLGLIWPSLIYLHNFILFHAKFKKGNGSETPRRRRKTTAHKRKRKGKQQHPQRRWRTQHHPKEGEEDSITQSSSL